MERRTTIIIASVAVVIILLGSLGFYLLFIHDWEPLYPLNISDKDLIELGSTDDGMEKVVLAHNQFAFELYMELARNSTENIVFSPFSIYIALSMVCEGAQGGTWEELKEALHFIDDNQTRKGSFAAVQNDLNDRKGRVEVSLANKLWSQEGMTVKDDFAGNVNDYYFADIESKDISGDPEGSRQEINDWVEEQTRGKIKDLLPPDALDPSTVMAIVNAIYFSGEWETAFDKDDTRDGTFYTLDNGTVSVPMMYLDPEDLRETVEFPEYMDNEVHALELTYKGRSLSMLLMLPMDGEHWDPATPEKIFDLEKSMSAERLQGINQGLEPAEMPLSLPKWEFETEFPLEEKLGDLGIVKAFDPVEADLSGIIDDASLFIGEGYHKAYIKVDEKGTTAAAATAFTADCGAAMSFDADRPFMYVIQDRETGLILFMGRVMDPSK
ncbi:MAG: serpin family protein [Candidatus Thermoplasmatota archaeon]|nr:serpin family protein [Candidatus Thermoplasmatota archaeon]